MNIETLRTATFVASVLIGLVALGVFKIPNRILLLGMYLNTCLYMWRSVLSGLSWDIYFALAWIAITSGIILFARNLNNN